MYISRTELNMKNPQIVQHFTHLGIYHDWIERAFPQDFQPNKNYPRVRHLWRIDHFQNHTYVLIVSPTAPHPEKLEKYAIKNSTQEKPYDAFLQRIQNGHILRFKLTANPTHYVNDKVKPHLTAHHQQAWFNYEANKHGFAIVNNSFNQPICEITDQSWPILEHHGAKINLAQATFEGILQVTNADKLKQALIKGIGREKAYGMGLLTLMPLEKLI